MPNGKITTDLHLNGETIAIPPYSVPDHVGLVVPTRTILEGAYEPAQLAFARAIQSYADKLAIESANQEASERVPGASSKEIIESAVIRARDALDKKVALEIRKRSPFDPYTLAGAPIFLCCLTCLMPSSPTPASVICDERPEQYASHCIMAWVELVCIYGRQVSDIDLPRLRGPLVLRSDCERPYELLVNPHSRNDGVNYLDRKVRVITWLTCVGSRPPCRHAPGCICQLYGQVAAVADRHLDLNFLDPRLARKPEVPFNLEPNSEFIDLSPFDHFAVSQENAEC